MYSGTTLRTKSGRVMGAHQKIDRVARRHFADSIKKELDFPSITQILHFEGLNGPDGIKRKSPGRDEPWHFVDPRRPDGRLMTDISWHMTNLTDALVAKNTVRAAFEAAWLAHAVTDGLTPAHHEPFESELERLRGEDMSTRTSIKAKFVMPGGGSPKQFIKNNWEFWGAKGMMTTHAFFEGGVATTISSLKFEHAAPSANDRVRVRQEGFEVVFSEALQDIAHLDLYGLYQRKGWTRRIAQLTRAKLVPKIIETVVLAWYAAYMDALDKKRKRLR